jgi:hypothetical protein
MLTGRSDMQQQKDFLIIGHSAALPQPNPKHEIRNSKQIRMTKIRMI